MLFPAMWKLLEKLFILIFFSIFAYSCFIALEKLMADDKLIILDQADVGKFKFPTLLICPGQGVHGSKFDDVLNAPVTPNISYLNHNGV